MSSPVLRFLANNNLPKLNAFKTVFVHRASVNVQDKDGKTALLIVIERQLTEILTYMLEYHEKEKKKPKGKLIYPLDFSLSDSQGQNSIIYAVKTNNLEILKLLINMDDAMKQVDWNQKVGDHYSMLHYLCSQPVTGNTSAETVKKQMELFHFLLQFPIDFKANVENAPLLEAWIAWSAAYEHDKRKKFNALKQEQEKEMTENPDGEAGATTKHRLSKARPELEADIEENQAVILRLIERALEEVGDDFSKIKYNNTSGRNILSLCCIWNQPKLLSFFLKKLAKKTALGEYLESVDREGNTPLLCCCSSLYSFQPQVSRIECAKLLLASGADVNHAGEDTYQRYTPLLRCLHDPSKGTHEVATLLLDYPVDLYYQNPLNQSPVSEILSFPSLKVLKKMIDHCNLDLTSYIPGLRETPAEFLYTRFLLWHESQQNYHQENWEAFKLLMSYGASPGLALYNLLSWSPLIIDEFKKFIEFGADINITYKPRMNLLMLVVARDQANAFNFLLSHGPDLDARYSVSLCEVESKPHRKQMIFTKNLICDICGCSISTSDMVSHCGISLCDFDICESCSFFQYYSLANKHMKGSKRASMQMGVTALDIARRLGNPFYLNKLEYLVSAKHEGRLGEAISSTKMFNHCDALMNAGVTNEIIHAVSTAHLERIGINNTAEGNQFLSIVNGQ